MNHKRMKGNDAFKSKDYKSALALYLDSLKDVLRLKKMTEWYAREIKMAMMTAQNEIQYNNDGVAGSDIDSRKKMAIPIVLRLKICSAFIAFLKNEHFLVLLNISTVYYRQYDIHSAMAHAQMACNIREDDLSCSKMALYLLRNGDMSFKYYYEKIKDITPFLELKNAVDGMIDSNIVKYCKNVWGDEVNDICYGNETLRTYLVDLADDDTCNLKPKTTGKCGVFGDKSMEGVGEAKESGSTDGEEVQSRASTKNGCGEEENTNLEKENCARNAQDDAQVNSADAQGCSTRLNGISGGLFEKPFSCKTLDVKFVFKVLLDGIRLYKNVFNVYKINVKGKYYVFGDTHGNLRSTYEAIRRITHNFSASFEDHLIFNGDFVDRGKCGLELVVFFILLKLSYPRNVHMNRGNHEFAVTNRQFDLYDQITRRYPFHGTFVYEAINVFFQALPLCTIANDSVFIVHGGLPADRFTIQDVYKLNRFVTKVSNGLLAGLMWSDPVEITGHEPSRRGIGVHYGQDVTERFLGENNLKLVVRSHEYFEECYRTNHGGKTVTVFSSSNYVESGNFAVYLVFNGDNYENYEVVRFC